MRKGLKGISLSIRENKSREFSLCLQSFRGRRGGGYIYLTGWESTGREKQQWHKVLERARTLRVISLLERDDTRSCTERFLLVSPLLFASFVNSLALALHAEEGWCLKRELYEGAAWHAARLTSAQRVKRKLYNLLSLFVLRFVGNLHFFCQWISSARYCNTRVWVLQ